MSDSQKHFSLDEFKKWMRTHDDEPKMVRHDSFVGLHVESKISTRKLADKLETEDDNAEELAADFVNNGGIIAEVNGKHFLVEVDSGKFYIHRNYVSRD